MHRDSAALLTDDLRAIWHSVADRAGHRRVPQILAREEREPAGCRWDMTGFLRYLVIGRGYKEDAVLMVPRVWRLRHVGISLTRQSAQPQWRGHGLRKGGIPGAVKHLFVMESQARTVRIAHIVRRGVLRSRRCE